MAQEMVISKELSYLAELSVGMFDDAGYMSSSFPNSISIKGNRFAFKSAEGRSPLADPTKLHFVTLGIKAPPSRQWYAGAFDPENASPPDCFSYDGIIPDVPGPVVQSRMKGRQADTCGACLMGQWGSASSAKGAIIPACRTHKDIVVKVMGVEGAWLLQIPPNSIRKQWAPLVNNIKKVAEKEQAKHGKSSLTMLTCVVEATFDENELGTLNFRPLGYLSQSEVPSVMALAKDTNTILETLWGPEGATRMTQWTNSVNKMPPIIAVSTGTATSNIPIKQVTMEMPKETKKEVPTKPNKLPTNPQKTLEKDVSNETDPNEVDDILRSMGMLDG